MILEPHCSGHHMHYVRWVVQEALLRGHCVSLVTQAHCLEHPLYLAMQRQTGGIRTALFPSSPYLSEERLAKQQGVAGLVRQQFIYYRLLSRYFRGIPEHERPDLVFVPYLDYYAYAMGVLGS